jgi:hypothetical protein
MDDAEYRTLPVPEGGVPGEASFVIAGDYTVTGAHFEIQLDEAEPRHYTIPQQLRFIPLEDGTSAGETQIGEQNEELRALGYL